MSDEHHDDHTEKATRIIITGKYTASDVERIKRAFNDGEFDGLGVMTIDIEGDVMWREKQGIKPRQTKDRNEPKR
jgi:hypothetical protein